MREIFHRIAWYRKAVSFFSALAVLVLIGPFDTYSDLDLWSRLVFWSIIMSGVGMFMHGGIVAAMTSPISARLPQLLQVAIGAGFAAIPGAALVVFVNMVFRDGAGPRSYPKLWLEVAIIGLIIGAVEYINWRSHSQTAAPEAKPPVPEPREAREEIQAHAPVPLLDTRPDHALQNRLGADRRGEIISLSMKDHYVEVTTVNGTELLLLRFSDALAELGALDGFRLHRSHWASAAHIGALKRQGNRRWVVLSDGRELPVSATYSDAISRAIA